MESHSPHRMTVNGQPVDMWLEPDRDGTINLMINGYYALMFRPDGRVRSIGYLGDDVGFNRTPECRLDIPGSSGPASVVVKRRAGP